jgi:putative transposase
MMAARNIARPVVLTDEQKEQLESFAASRSLPHAQVERAKIVLKAAQGMKNIHIAEQLSTTRETVGKWRKRFVEQGIEGLYDELRPGRPRSIKDERLATLIRKTLKTKPEDGTHWSCRTMAKQVGISKSTVQRVWNTFGLQPHRQRYFKLSNDPFFIEKLRDIVGLYLNPPENAMVLCVDEKSQGQALQSEPSRCFLWD